MTVLKYWRENGLLIRPHYIPGSLSEEDIKIILDSHVIYAGNSTEAEKHLPWHATTILRHWRKADLQIRKPGSQPKFFS